LWTRTPVVATRIIVPVRGGPDRPSQVGKKPRGSPPPTVPEAMVIHTIASAEPERPHTEATDGVEQVPLEEGRPERTIQLGQEMTAVNRHSLVSLLREYRDVLAFRPEEMPSITPTVMEHRLNVDPLHRSVIQKKRHMGLEGAATANAEVQKLLEAGFVRECQYPE